MDKFTKLEEVLKDINIKEEKATTQYVSFELPYSKLNDDRSFCLCEDVCFVTKSSSGCSCDSYMCRCECTCPNVNCAPICPRDDDCNYNC